MVWKLLLKADKPLINMNYISEAFGDYISHHVADVLDTRLSRYRGPFIVRKENEEDDTGNNRDEQLRFRLNDPFSIEISSYGDAKIDNKSFSGSFEGKFYLITNSYTKRDPVLEKHYELLGKIPFDVTYSGKWTKPYQVAKLSKNQGVKDFKIQTNNLLEGLQKVAEIPITDTDGASFEIEIMSSFSRKESIDFDFEKFRDMMDDFEFEEYQSALGDVRGDSETRPMEDRIFYDNKSAKDKDRITDKSKEQAWRDVLSRNKKGEKDEKYQEYIELLGGKEPSVNEITRMMQGEAPRLENVWIEEEILTEEDLNTILKRLGITRQDLKTYKDNDGSEYFAFELLLGMGFGEVDAYLSDEGGEIMVEGNFTPISLKEYLKLDGSEYIRAKKQLKNIKLLMPSEKGKGDFMKLLGMATSVTEGPNRK
tara:strand:+ start:321 stop:1592 length:1272 start_codon:yes stop_codon:yes gene_type:complete